ncbi:hypothetical protein [Entomobacter blattae]|uniref:Uncharacterized protein n=1 Tax=Entomobacter blattae TaxID=2762277 RepID=A0A7H1NSP7_9PROT|nr:hypothetical protein [Entomobacter blattae]QNT78807.1 hypothetical protein JGUZn3_15840 [Entomobacter blattae]
MKSSVSFNEAVGPYLFDSELFQRLPDYPKVSLELKIYEVDDSTVLLVTDNSFIVMHGKNIFQRITPIVKLLDGQKSINALINDNPNINKMAIWGMISFLYSKNLLESGNDTGNDLTLEYDEFLSSYFGYLSSKNGLALSRNRLYTELTQKKIGVINDCQNIFEDFSLLAKNINTIENIHKDSPCDIYIILNYEEKNVKLTEAARLILQTKKKPLFFITSTEKKVLIGPLVLPGFGVTPGCFSDFLNNPHEELTPFIQDPLDISSQIIESIIVSFFSLNMENVPISTCIKIDKPTAFFNTAQLKIPHTHYWTSNFNWLKNELLGIDEINKIFNLHVTTQRLPPPYRPIVGYEMHYYPNNKKLASTNIPLFPKIHKKETNFLLLEWLVKHILPICKTIYSINKNTDRSLCPSGGNIKSALLFISAYDQESSTEVFFQYNPYTNSFIFINEIHALT